MFQKEIAFYLGQEKPTGFTGYLAEGNFFLIIEVEEGFSSDNGREFLKLIKDGLVEGSVNNLSSLDNFINQAVQKGNLPANFSMACGFFKDKILYLKTTGRGKVFLRRKKELVKIIENDHNASGLIQIFDLFVFTTENFVMKIGGEDKLREIFNNRNPHQIVDEITPQLKSNDDQGLVALFVQLTKKEEIISDEEEKIFISQEKPWNKFFGAIKSFYPEKIGRKKTTTFLMVIIIGLLLFWSVGLGFQRRKQAEITKRIQTTKELINQKLNQAEEVAFLNLPRAQVLISESKQEMEKLKKKIGDKRNEIRELEKLVVEKENKITKKEEKNYQEFYDLTVDNSKAKGDKFYLDKDNLAILDRQGGYIFLLSILKKSLVKKTEGKLKSTELIAIDDEEVFFFVENDGIYKIDKEGQLKKVIENDKDWGEIADIRIYNGNIYLLDKSKDEIYKYLVAESGYSGKNSYFKSGEAVALKEATSIAIDSSIYIGFGDYIRKYTAGSRDEFKTDFPEEGVNLNKIFTTKDLEKVYGWDKRKGAIYILGKNGTYERQIKSSIFTKGEDIVIYNDKAFVLADSKIYVIE